MQYRDFLGNTVHHFDIAASHTELAVKAQSVVEVLPTPAPDPAKGGSLRDLDVLVNSDGYYEMLLPSGYARSTPLLEDVAQELRVERRATPLEKLLEVSEGIHKSFEYAPNSTKVDSPIDHALAARKGVCQDFAHIMIALVRRLGVPCRYVSGYLYHTKDDASVAADGASHAWTEALLPGLGWVGFDPTNNLLCGDRHIRVAVGRDYAEVPPTRGVYKGGAQSELSVAVTVGLSDAVVSEDAVPAMVLRRTPVVGGEVQRIQEQEQQQQ